VFLDSFCYKITWFDGMDTTCLYDFPINDKQEEAGKAYGESDAKELDHPLSGNAPKALPTIIFI
jgi:hypothetical protein